MAYLPITCGAALLLLAGSTVRSADPAATEKHAIAELEQLGAKIGFKERAKRGPVVKVTLDISRSEAGLKHLDALPELRDLEITTIELSQEALAHLKGLTKLESLSLSASRLPEKGLGELASLPTRALSLVGQKITDRHLAELKQLEQLASLELRATRCTDSGLGELKPLTNLRRLKLYGNVKITDAGLVHLKELEGLRELDLYAKPYLGTDFTDAALGNLMELKNLESLSIQSHRITERGMDDLRKALPKCKIERK